MTHFLEYLDMKEEGTVKLNPLPDDQSVELIISQCHGRTGKPKPDLIQRVDLIRLNNHLELLSKQKNELNKRHSEELNRLIYQEDNINALIKDAKLK